MERKIINNLRKFVFVFILGIFLLAPSLSDAYPEMVRDGYANCITCHVSPSGGGILTDYGRALSSQILSTWSNKDEENFLYGVVTPPPGLLLGGDFRALQLYMNSPTFTASEFIFMQADAEAAYTVGQFTVDGTFGLDSDGSLISRRHYINYRPSDEISLRAGKFLPSYGIYTENHSIGVKRGIGKDQGTETYNIEGAWIGEKTDAFVTAIFGRPDNLQLGAETGVALSSSVFLDNRFKVGASYFYGTRDVEQRHVVGPYAILGFTQHLFVLAELDFQFVMPKGITPTLNPNQNGLVDDVRVDYELMQGLHIYALQEYSRLNFASAISGADAYGGGIQIFPRPHLEINAVYERQRIGGSSAPFADYAYAMLHFYP